MLLDSDCEKGKRQGEAARGSERTILNESERKDYGEKRERESALQWLRKKQCIAPGMCVRQGRNGSLSLYDADPRVRTVRSAQSLLDLIRLEGCFSRDGSEDQYVLQITQITCSKWTRRWTGRALFKVLRVSRLGSLWGHKRKGRKHKRQKKGAKQIK